jgi:hypothetical protein
MTTARGARGGKGWGPDSFSAVIDPNAEPVLARGSGAAELDQSYGRTTERSGDPGEGTSGWTCPAGG